MTKRQRSPNPQLELRLLSDMKGRPEKVRVGSQGAVAASGQQTAVSQGASDGDLGVYHQIASNYFDSLCKD